jgi:hypothetical protein
VAWERNRRDWAATATDGFLILLPTAVADVLIASLVPTDLLPARRRWRRAQGTYEEAGAKSRADQEADAIATHAWLGLVRGLGRPPSWPAKSSS